MYRRNCQDIDIKVDYLAHNDYNIVVLYSQLEQSSIIMVKFENKYTLSGHGRCGFPTTPVQTV